MTQIDVERSVCFVGENSPVFVDRRGAAKMLCLTAAVFWIVELLCGGAACAQPAKNYLVLIPGVFGSKLDVCLGANSTACDPIWDPEAGKVSSAELAKINDQRPLRVEMVRGEFYGEILRFISKFQAEFSLVPYPYDWRQSNAISGQKLTETLCSLATTQGESRFYFVAHSMGGLVLKHSLRDFRCPNKRTSIAFMLFVATPHTGAEKTVYNLVHGYRFIDWGSNPLQRFGQEFEDRFLPKKITFDGFSEAVNEGSTTFASFYELLPIQNGGACAEQLIKNGLEHTIVTEEKEPVSVYDSQNWEKYDFLRSTAAHGLTQNFYVNALPAYLAAAQEAACDAAKFDPSRRGPVRYIAGTQTPTIGTVVIIGKNIATTVVPGDGTVPAVSALNKANSAARNHVYSGADHVQIINGTDVRSAVERWQSDIRRQRKAEAGAPTERLADNSQAQSPITDMDRVDLDLISPWSMYPTDWEGPQAGEFVKSDADLLMRWRLHPTTLAKFADGLATRGESGYRAAETMVAMANQLNSQTKKKDELYFSLLVSAAMALNRYGDRDEAKALLEYVIENAPKEGSSEQFQNVAQSATNEFAKMVIRTGP